MVKRGDDVFVLWPRYFNARLSRAEGRRVRSDEAVKDPDAAWIASAARKAGFEAEVDEDVTDPRVPYRKVGRVLVPRKGSKEQVIDAVATHMR